MRQNKDTAKKYAEPLLEASLSYSDQEKKMDAWHSGARKQNVKACSDEKLKMNLDICERKNYHWEGKQLHDECVRRGMAVKGTVAPTYGGDCAINVRHLPEDFGYVSFADVAERMGPNDYELDLLSFMKDSKGKAGMPFMHKACHDYGVRLVERSLLVALIGAICLKETDWQQFILQAITKQRPDNAEYTTKRRAEIKQAIHIIMSNKPLMDKIESLLGDETNESLNESEDIEEDVEKHDELNPKLFDKDRKLKPEVREKLMEIADDFKSKLEEDEIKFKLKDVKIVGSNCSYNYNKDSDLDLHLVADTKSLKCPDDLYPLLYSAYRSIWNKNHDVEIYGIPVELFVETDDTEQLNDKVKEIKEGYRQNLWNRLTDLADKDLYDGYVNTYGKKIKYDGQWIQTTEGAIGDMEDEHPSYYNDNYYERVLAARKRKGYLGADDAWTNFLIRVIAQLKSYSKNESLTEARVKTALKSNGVYSVMRDKWIKEPVAAEIPDVNQDALDKEIAKWDERYNALPDDINAIDEFIADLYDARKVGIRDEGEYCLPNLAFKEFRSAGKLDALKERKARIRDAELSLE